MTPARSGRRILELISLALFHALGSRYGGAVACGGGGLYATAYDWHEHGAFGVLLPVAFSLALLALAQSRWVLSAGRVVGLSLAACLAADVCGASGVIDAGRSAAKGFVEGWSQRGSTCRL